MNFGKIINPSSLVFRVGISFLAVALLPLLGVALLTFRYAEQILHDEVMTRLSLIADTKSSQVEHFLIEERKHLGMVAGNQVILDALRGYIEAFREDGEGSSAYAAVDARFRQQLTGVKKTLESRDLFLVSPAGDIVFSVMREADFTTNLRTGPYKKSALAQTFNKTVSQDQIHMSGFAHYAPTNGPAAFIATPIKKQGELIGVFALQLSIDELQGLASDYTNLGKSGEIVLASRNKNRATFIAPLRHDPNAAFQRSVTLGSSEATAIQRAVLGENGAGFSIDYRGKEIIAMWRYVPQWRVGMVVKIDKDEAFSRELALKGWTTVVIVFTMILVMGMALWLSKYIASPIEKLAQAVGRVTEGDLSVSIDIHTRDEIGRLADTFDNMLKSQREVARQASIIAKGAVSDMDMEIRGEKDELSIAMNRMIAMFRDIVSWAGIIAEGDYSREILPRGPDDELAVALRAMTRTLREVSEKNKKQNWLKTGQNELYDRMRGEPDIQTLAYNIITYLAKYLKAQIGAIYVIDEERGDMKYTAGYAYTKVECFNARVKLGEGLAGQAALERQPLSVSSLPADYAHIGSATGDAGPRNVMIFPFLYEGRLQGVVELGAFRQFNDTESEFLRTVMDNIAIAFYSAQSRERMRELLEESQRQSEELEVQQEEMRQTNEELEKQADALRKSEQILQHQQEELRVANEELEERTDALAKERDAVREKNDKLKRAREVIEQKAGELEAASQYKSEFLANMSHELRTPLNSILILSQLLMTNEGNNLTEKQLEFAQTVHSSGSDLLALINEILDISKVEAGKMDVHVEEMRLAEFAHGIQKTFGQIAANKGLSLTINSDDSLPAAMLTDPQKLKQIVKNLLSNAFKFTEQGGVTVEIGRPEPDTDLSRSGLVPEETVAIAVADSGIGVPGDRQESIFEAFQQADGTTSRKYGGTGLGLAISRELAVLLGGEIQLHSELNEGSVFTLYLPERPHKSESKGGPVEPDKVKPAAAPTPKIETPSEPQEEPESPPLVTLKQPRKDDSAVDDRKNITPEDKTLLIIEDDPIFSRTFLELAQKRGFKCLLADNGETGLHFADYYKPSAIILDIGLPGIDGWSVMERLKANPVTRHIPVHFISAIDRHMDAMKMGAIGYLTKPVSLEELDNVFKTVENVISKRIKRLLVVEDDDTQRRSIIELIGGDEDVITRAVAGGAEAYKLLAEETFDCVILDLGLKDMSGLDLLAKIKKDKTLCQVPVIIYTGRDLSMHEDTELRKYAESIIVKGAHSPQRLLEETTLFLHRVEEDLPEDKRRMLRMIHDKESVLENKTILIVDDDMRNVFALSSVMEEKGMRVIAARNGKDGLDKLEQNPDIDLVLMDIMMPEMDGYDTTRAIRKKRQFRELPIIALTAKAMKGDRNKCIDAGASDYMAKPVDIEKLLSLLRVWLFR